MRFLILLFYLVCSSLHAAVDAIQKTVLTTNVYVLGTNLFLTNGVLNSVDSASGISFPLPVVDGGTGADLSSGLSGAIPYFDFPSGKFVVPGLVYTNALLWEPSLGTLSIIHTNSTSNPLLILQDNGASAPSIQFYSSRLVIANTNLSLEAVGPFSVDLRVDGSNKVQAVQGGMSLVGKTNIISDNGTGITFNSTPIQTSILRALYYNGHLGFDSQSISPTNIFRSNLSAGITDLFTVPAGRRFMLMSITASTTNLTSTTSFSLLKTNSVYYRYSNSSSVTTNFPQSLATSSDNTLLEPGEIIAVTNSLAGVNAILFGLLFPTNSNIYTPRVLSLTSGNNTLYTCPSGKCAVGMPMAGNSSAANPNLFIFYANDSGASRTNSLYVVPSGGVADSSNVVWRKIIANTSTASQPCGLLFPGDSIVMSTDSTAANNWLRVTVSEIPFP